MRKAILKKTKTCAQCCSSGHETHSAVLNEPACTELPVQLSSGQRKGVPGLQTSLINEPNTNTHTYYHPNVARVIDS